MNKNPYEELIDELGIISKSTERIMPILQKMPEEKVDGMLSAYNEILNGISAFLRQLNSDEGHNH